MRLKIWIEFASTYSYLTVLRAETFLKKEEIDFEWSPFLLGPIFKNKGWSTSPFLLDPIKGNYMWRDVERRALLQNLPFKKPKLFPANGLRAARIMTAALGQHWCGHFAKEVFSAQFERGLDISADDTLIEALNNCGVDHKSWMELAETSETKNALYLLTKEAQEKGIFGAPSFTINNELFWGDDRLEDAVEWIKRHQLNI